MPRHSTVLVFTLAAVVTAAVAPAQVTTDQGASIVVLPVVIADGSRDTIVELVNGSPQRVFARCVYTPGDQGGGEAPAPFDLVLVAHQPTHWAASRGRPVDATDAPCNSNPLVTDCDGAGIDPGAIPPVPDGFSGDLFCAQIDRSHAPISGNALRAVATLLDGGGEVATYAGIGLAGVPGNDADATLCLGGAVSDACPRGAEYAGCPRDWLINLRAEGTPLGPDENSPTLRSSLVIATCSRRAGNGAAIVKISVTNEFEQRLSTSILVQQRAEIPLANRLIFNVSVAGTTFIHARVGTAAGSPGVAIVAMSERVTDAGASAGAHEAAVPHADGVHDLQDRILLAAP